MSTPAEDLAAAKAHRSAPETFTVTWLDLACVAMLGAFVALCTLFAAMMAFIAGGVL